MGVSFGKFPTRSGKGGSYQATEVPLDLVKNLSRNTALPITITTAGVVSVAASKTNPVPIWNGNDFILLKETLSYTWADAATNKILTTATGAETTGSPTAAVYYYYVGLKISDGTLEIYASVDAPSYVEGPFEGSILGHPGTAKTRFWNYVGWSAVNATTGTHLPVKKVGFQYEIQATSVAVTSAWALVNFATRIPAHPVEVAGSLHTVELSCTVAVGSNTIGSTLGAQEFKSGTLAAIEMMVPFSGVVPTTTGGVFGSQSTTVPAGGAGFIRINRVKDLV